MSKFINRPANILMQILDCDMTRFDENFLNVILANRVNELHFQNESDYFNLLIHNEQEKIIFCNLLNINYSVFFRNTFTFTILEHFVIPKILQQKSSKKKSHIRVWSCACASGQEPYSLAMMLENSIHFKNGTLSYQIFATDIDKNQIELAQKGSYSDQAIQNIPFRDIQKWFLKEGEQFIIQDKLKQNITFSQFDLLESQMTSPPDSIFGGFDVIMCANVLFYFNESTRNQLFAKLKSASDKNCFFITGEVERDYFLKLNFVEVFPHSSIFQMPKYVKL